MQKYAMAKKTYYFIYTQNKHFIIKSQNCFHINIKDTWLNTLSGFFLKAIPYVGKIPGGIKMDLAVVFQGTVPADAKR